jgi:hypothetical protein
MGMMQFGRWTGSRPSFSPLSMFAASEPGLWLDPSDAANLDWRYNFATGSASVGDGAYWPASSTQNGVTVTKLASGIDTDGLPYVDVRYQGTATSTFQAAVYSFANSIVPAVIGQTFTASAICRVIGGSTANVTLLVAVAEITSSDAYLVDTTSAQVVTTSDTLLTATRTLNNPSMAKTRTGVVILFSNGATIDVSYRIKALQFERGSVRTTYQPITDLHTELRARFPSCTLFQDTAGTQPVSTPGQSVALELDKSRGLTLGSQLLVDPEFNTASVWALSAGFSVTGGLLLGSGVGAFGSAIQLDTVTLIAGRTYEIEFTVDSISSGGIWPVFTGGTQVTGSARTTAGTSRQYMIAVTGNNVVRLQATASGFTGTVSRFSVRELAGNHATQSTAASRPLYALHPSSGIRNVANGSADVGNNAIWQTGVVQNGVTVTKVASGFDTDGLPFADYRFQGTASGTLSASVYEVSNSRAAAASGQTYTASLLCQRTGGATAGVNGLRVDIVEETAPTTFVGSTAGTPTTSATEVTVSTSRAATTGNQMRLAVSLSVTNGATIDVTYRIKALQFERGSTRTNYQFNYAATNIVEPPFSQLGHLLFDGVDDFLVTPTITPGTDKVQVFAGVRKLSDAAVGIIAELGPAAFSTDGSFALVASNGGANYGFITRGTVANASIATASSYVAPITNVVSCAFDNAGSGTASAAQVRPRVNAVDLSRISNTTAGNYLAQPLYVGRRAGTVLPFNGRLYSLIVRFGPNLDANQITQTETWVNTRTGAY